MTQGRDRIDVFDTARHMAELADEPKAALGKLEDQRRVEEREAMDELIRQLNKKYVALIIEILPAEQKPKYEKVIAAMNERDEQRAAARKALLEVIDKTRTEQGVEGQGAPDSVPFSKTDLIRRCIKLTDEQRTQVDEIRRDGFAAMREEMRADERPDFRDPAAMAKFMDRMRKARENTDNASAEAMAKVLTDEQKKAYATASKAYEAYQAKIKEIDEAYGKKLVEAVGEEKAKELQQRRAPRGGFGGPPMMGGDRQPPGGDRRPAGGQRRRPGAEF